MRYTRDTIQKYIRWTKITRWWIIVWFLIFSYYMYFASTALLKAHIALIKTSVIPSEYYLYLCSSTPRQIWEAMCFLCSKREFLLGLISQCQSSWAWAEMQTLTEAQLDSVVCFLKYWYKMNPAVRGVMPVKWLGVSHTFRKPAGAFEGCSLCDPKWDPAEILLCPWARHWKEWHVQTFLCGVTQYMGAVMLHEELKAP